MQPQQKYFLGSHLERRLRFKVESAICFQSMNTGWILGNWNSSIRLRTITGLCMGDMPSAVWIES